MAFLLLYSPSNATMAAPVLVRAYQNDRIPSFRARGGRGTHAQALPPVSAYAFSDILRTADCPEFQLAIDGIAEICAKNRMSLADEHSSHLPPLGEITATTATVRPQYLRPNMRRALTSVPEASSGSSEGSHQSKKRKGSLFGGFKRRPYQQSETLRKIRIGSMGRMVSVTGTTAMVASIGFPHDNQAATQKSNDDESSQRQPQQEVRRPSQAESSLQMLLSQNQSTPNG